MHTHSRAVARLLVGGAAVWAFRGQEFLRVRLRRLSGTEAARPSDETNRIGLSRWLQGRPPSRTATMAASETELERMSGFSATAFAVLITILVPAQIRSRRYALAGAPETFLPLILNTLAGCKGQITAKNSLDKLHA